MTCPWCGHKMERGVVQSARHIFFTTKAHKFWFRPNVEENGDVVVSSHNWTRPTVAAYHCAYCKKVILDYSAAIK